MKTAAKSPKVAARQDVAAHRWNPRQFKTESERDAYGRAWDYFYSMELKPRNWHAKTY